MFKKIFRPKRQNFFKKGIYKNILQYWVLYPPATWLPSYMKQAGGSVGPVTYDKTGWRGRFWLSVRDPD